MAEVTEIQFADGKRVVDDAYVAPIHEVTNGEPERYPVQSVMDRVNGFVERSILREAQSNVLKEHFRQWG